MGQPHVNTGKGTLSRDVRPFVCLSVCLSICRHQHLICIRQRAPLWVMMQRYLASGGGWSNLVAIIAISAAYGPGEENLI